ncbi:MAG: C-terminal helicase domain-containing protein, partial [Alphaproteobacteria bacterium]|nr:C-terminal helicase domain-containing protein [Alphaproteobacteria bacterium]
VEVARPASTNTNITQYVVPAPPRKKREVLRALLRQPDVKTAIIFANRKTTVRELVQSLKRHGFSAGEIHGDMDQPSRLKELERFKAEHINILVASDVAARGLDIKGVTHVFNHDVPWHPDDYVHRIGRTGRGGATGIAITLVSDADAEHIDAIEKLTGHKIATLEGFGAVDAAPAPSKPAPEKKAARPRRESQPAAQQPSRPKTQAKPARSAPARDPDDDGWNGPVPGFLSRGF